MGNVKPILDTISSRESPKFGYTSYYGRGREGVGPAAPPKELTEMTVDEVLQWQKTNNPPGPGTAAAGRYQIVEETLGELKTKLKLDGSELFDEEMQDKMAMALLKKRGYDKWVKGDLSDEEFANNLAKEWAGLPVVSGAKKGQGYLRATLTVTCKVLYDIVTFALRRSNDS